MAAKKNRRSRPSRGLAAHRKSHGNSLMSHLARVVAWHDKSLSERNRYNDPKVRAYHQGEADAFEKVMKLLGD